MAENKTEKLIKIGALHKSLAKSEKETLFKTSKELVTKMESLGYPKEKGHNDSLSEKEFNILFASLSDTYSTEIDIKSYIEGAATVPGHGGKTEKETAKQSDKKPASPMVEKPIADKPAKTERASKPAVKSADAATAPQEKAVKQQSVEVKKTDDSKPKQSRTEAAKTTAQPKPVSENKGKTEPVKADKQEETAKHVPATSQEAPKSEVAKKPEQGKQTAVSKPVEQPKSTTEQKSKTEQAKVTSEQKPKTEQPKREVTITTGKKSQQSQRSFTAPDFSKSGKGDQRRAEQPKKPQPTQQSQPQQKPKGGIDISANNGGSIRNANGRARVVDTRGSGAVDLSKYDEKFEKFASDRNLGDTRGGRVSDGRTKKGGRFDKEKDKERMELERARRQQMEKARKLPVSITVPDEITVGELASRLKITSADLIKKLFMLGVMANVNQTVDFDTAFLVADEMGAKVTKEVVVTIEDKLFEEDKDPEDKLVPRAPVVCVMGHVDHGKTSLLDSIRHTHVTSGEAGGITQHIGAYRVRINDRDITFLDTPGHEAFTAMRARGAKSTDIAILVVAADDGIMPQTVEAINHAKAAGIEIVVAINKMDKQAANPENIKQELTQYELVPEEWGGDTICVPVSALTGKGIDDLLENVLLVAEMKELKANPDRRAKGIVIEAKLDKGRGPVATVLVQNGTLKAGDIVIAGSAVGRVRAMISDNGSNIKKAGPSVPVEIVGLDEVPQPGDEFNAVENEKMARELAEQRKEKLRDEILKSNARGVSLETLFENMGADEAKTLNVIVKADVQGSAEAVKGKLLALSNDEVKVNVIHTAVGGVTESDVTLASASGAIIIAFNVRPDRTALDIASRQKVDIRTYRVIYDCVEEITAAMKGMLAPTYKESVIGHGEVRQAIRVPNVGIIAGCYITNGKVTRGCSMRILRDSVVLCEDKVDSLRRFKDDVKEVAEGYECGIGIEKFNDIKEGDVLEFFEMVEVER